MVYDGDCGFCRKWIGRWKKLTGERVRYEPYQQAAPAFPQIPLARFQAAVQFIGPGGEVSEGAEAVFKSLSTAPGLGWLATAYARLPGLAFLAEGLYRWVAGHRGFLSRADSCGLSPADDPPTYFLARRFFLKVLALVYLAAFASLGPQLGGLIGAKGILPVGRFLSAVRAQTGWKDWADLPTLCWLGGGDGLLQGLCAGGMGLAVLLFFDIAPAACLFLLWLFYLSLVKAGQDFLSFQWDNLLLESGLLSLMLVPWTLKKGRTDAAALPGTAAGLFRWLLFRLMFSSGIVKLLSGDETWRNLTALSFHYGTQPLPTPPAWYLHQAPLFFHQASCACLFAVELAAPFFLFGPRRWRPAAFAALVSLQVLILLTGNYGFFNWLSLGLCLFGWEDQAWPAFLRKSGPPRTPAPPRPWAAWVRRGAGAALLLLGLLQMTFTLGVRFNPPGPLAVFFRAAEPFQSVNAYGLFAVMTTTRPEIEVEGSDDGKNWKAYGFRWKPGGLQDPPHWVAPYQPRLDWQMWFAALSAGRPPAWFTGFLVRLLQGSPQVLSLLKDDPFAGRPPRWVRAGLYDYAFTDAAQRARTGDWWTRRYRGGYFPPLSLDQVRGLEGY